MAFLFRDGVRRDYSGCDVLWFSGNQTFPPGSFVEGQRVVSSSGTWLSSGRWLYSGRGKNDVVGCTWSKSIDGPPAGTCVVQLKKGMEWFDMIQPGDAMLVFMSSLLGGSSKKTVLVSIVFVDRVEEGTSVDRSGAQVEVVNVFSRDVGKIFQEYSTVFDPAFLAREQIFYTERYVQALGTKFGLSPVEMVLKLVSIIFDRGATDAKLVDVQWRFPGNEQVPIASLLDLSSFVQAPLFGYCAPHVLAFAEAGNVWNFLSSYANDCVNEFFFDVRDLDGPAAESKAFQEDVASAFVTDVGDVQAQRDLRDQVAHQFILMGRGLTGSTRTLLHPAPFNFPQDSGTRTSTLAMVLRQRPYDTGAFMKLPVNVVDEQEVIQATLGRSYANVLNFFHVNAAPNFAQITQEFTFGTIVNPKSISQFGLRRKDIESRYVFTSSGGALDWDRGKTGAFDISSLYRFYSNLISTWNAFNERFLEGGILLHFRPDIRIGTRLQLNRVRGIKPRTYQFYVQSVRHRFAFDPAQSTTELVLIRGFDQSLAGPEANAYWQEDGPFFPVRSPYEIYVDEAFRRGDNAGETDG